MLKDLAEKGLLTPEIEARLRSMKKVEEVAVSQTRMLYENQIPRLMLGYMERAYYDRATGKCVINTSPINSEQNIIFPTVGKPNKGSLFQPISFETRAQALSPDKASALNKESGHNDCWVRYFDEKGKPVVVHYDSGSVTVHSGDIQEAKRHIAERTRLVFLEYIGEVTLKRNAH